MLSRRKLTLALSTGFITLALTVGSAFAAELLGKIKSVDADKVMTTWRGMKMNDFFGSGQLRPDGRYVHDMYLMEVVVTVNSSTEWVNPKGKTLKKAPDLAKMNPGATLEITHENAVASKVVIKKGAAKKKKDAK